LRMYEQETKPNGKNSKPSSAYKPQEFVRKPDRYIAARLVDNTWQVTNKRTGVSNILHDIEFRKQFEAVPEAPVKKKWEPTPHVPMRHEVVDLPDGSTGVKLIPISEDLK